MDLTSKQHPLIISNFKNPEQKKRALLKSFYGDTNIQAQMRNEPLMVARVNLLCHRQRCNLTKAEWNPSWQVCDERGAADHHLKVVIYCPEVILFMVACLQ